MRRAAIDIDIQSVGGIAYDICIRAESIKHALCHHPSAAVCAVKPDPFALIGTRGKRDKKTDIAVSACRIVNRSAYLVIGRIRQAVRLSGGCLVDIFLDTFKDIVLHLFTAAVYELNAVVVIRVVACGYHYAAVEIIGSCYIRHTGSRGDM